MSERHTLLLLPDQRSTCVHLVVAQTGLVSLLLKTSSQQQKKFKPEVFRSLYDLHMSHEPMEREERVCIVLV